MQDLTTINNKYIFPISTRLKLLPQQPAKNINDFINKLSTILFLLVWFVLELHNQTTSTRWFLDKLYHLTCQVVLIQCSIWM
jgi:hypothetical protein